MTLTKINFGEAKGLPTFSLSAFQFHLTSAMKKKLEKKVHLQVK